MCSLPAVSPDAIHEHVKTKVQLEHKRLHYTAPEYAGTCTCTLASSGHFFVPGLEGFYGMYSGYICTLGVLCCFALLFV